MLDEKIKSDKLPKRRPIDQGLRTDSMFSLSGG
jgi:hypothetical protein